MHAGGLEPGSFRDRQGRVFYQRGKVYRGLSQEAMRNWQQLAATKFFDQYADQGLLIASKTVDPADRMLDAELTTGWAQILEHEFVPFISYPYEWSFGMLKDAALLQLDLMLAALAENMTMKDASAFNIQWRGTIPVFIDIPSFERAVPGEPWAGYRQYCQLFLYPLMLQAYKGVDFQTWLRGDIDGISVAQMANLMSPFDWFRPGVLTHIILQATLQRRLAKTERSVKADLKQAGFNVDLIKNNVRRLRRLTERLYWNPVQSEWSEYGECRHYSEHNIEQKIDFVKRHLATRRWGGVWDLGCNTGRFSTLAASNADYVIGMDADHFTVERFYKELRNTPQRAITPMVMNLTNPSPSLGWRGRERAGLVGRPSPDLVLSLALIHHIVIGANVPLEEFIDFLAECKAVLVIEFVTKDDPMVKILLRNKQDIYSDYELDVFENNLKARFDIKDRELLEGGTRVLFAAHPR